MRRLFKGGNYSRAETICGNMVCFYIIMRLNGVGLEFGKHVCVGGGCHGYVLMTIDVKSGDDISEESGGSIEESVGEVLCGNPLYLE